MIYYTIIHYIVCYTYTSTPISIYLSIYPSIYLYLSLYLSLSLSIYIYIYISELRDAEATPIHFTYYSIGAHPSMTPRNANFPQPETG